MSELQSGPTVRLATPLKSQTGANSADHLASIIPSDAEAATHPSVRLALGNSPPERNGTSDLESNAPNIRLAHKQGGQGGQGDNVLLGQKNVAQLPRESRPALLVSYVYLKPFLVNKHRYAYRDWVLDSGAFSAHNSGTEIKLQDYIDTCKRLLAEDPTLTEVFALDVIGDWRASEKNCEEMWRQGVPAIPAWHGGEPESVLLGLAKDYPKIALGGLVGMKSQRKRKICEQAFARVWPKKIHGFGVCSEDLVLALPWHSVDATNWELGPCKFGNWKSYGAMSVRGSNQNLRAEVEWYLTLERRARAKWAKQMAELDSLSPTGPSVRLAERTGGRNTFERERVASSGLPLIQEQQAVNAPSVRLAPVNPTNSSNRQITAFGDASS